MLTGIIAVAIGLGVMVLVHEWGHFVVARLFGVRVEVFSIGFGPRLFGVRRGPTDYRLSALPLGGYVRMAGDNPAEERRGDPDEFLSKPRWQRMSDRAGRTDDEFPDGRGAHRGALRAWRRAAFLCG